jgi:hypothetical protein
MQIKELILENFIKFSDKDRGKTYSYIGEIVKIDEENETFEILVLLPDSSNYYEIGFSLKKDEKKENSFNILKTKKRTKEKSEQKLEHFKTKPKGWSKFKKNPEKYISDNREKEEIKEPIKSTKERIDEMVQKNPRKKINTLLSIAKKEIGGNVKQLEAYIKLALVRRK